MQRLSTSSGGGQEGGGGKTGSGTAINKTETSNTEMKEKKAAKAFAKSKPPKLRVKLPTIESYEKELEFQ
jgi:hypothetical protein